jgi:UTP-glucose-1-phosphate uridylyltransferase
MKNSQSLFNSIKPLLQVCIKQADRHGMDEIRISKARAREILHLVLASEKELEQKNKQPNHFNYLDSIFSL